MRVVYFTHSLVSDWNHGNAHFLRGICSELISRGHNVRVYEPKNSWSVENLAQECGKKAVAKFKTAYPKLHSIAYDPKTLKLDEALSGADLVIVHEWNEAELVKQVGLHHRQHNAYHLLFHDTHHRCVSDYDAISKFDLSNYDGVLAFGRVVRDVYLSESLTNRAWVWHEAADTRVFKPIPHTKDRDLVWIGNWGDDEREEELQEYLIEPVRMLRLSSTVHGVRYPDEVRHAISEAGMEYEGWIPNFEVPRVFAHHRITVHIPRRPYVEALPGIPTIRVFEALACGIPLVCSPWEDSEGLFKPGQDYLVARNGREMRRLLREVLNDPRLARELAEHGRKTIMARHTCRHRVNELMDIYAELEGTASQQREAIA